MTNRTPANLRLELIVMFLSSVSQNKKQGYLLLDETTVASAEN